MRGPGPPQRHRQPGGLEHRTGVSAEQVAQARGELIGGEQLEDGLLLASEQLGEHAVDDDGGQGDGRLGLDAGGELDGLVDRHLLGRADRDEPGGRRVREDVEHPVGLGADEPDLHQVVDGLGRGQLAHDVPRSGRVDHHQVVGAFAHLVAELADGEDLAHPGSGGGDEVEGLGQRTDAADDGDLQLELQVLAEGRLGVHGHREQPGQDLLLLEPGGGRLVVPGDVPFGVDLADEHPLAAERGEERDGRGHRGLADPALAGHEDQLQVEERRRPCAPVVTPRRRCHRRRPGSGDPEADAAVGGGRVDLDVGDLAGGHPDLAALAIGEPEDGSVLGQRGLDVRQDLVALHVVGQLDVELLHRLDDPDPHVHLVRSFHAAADGDAACRIAPYKVGGSGSAPGPGRPARPCGRRAAGDRACTCASASPRVTPVRHTDRVEGENERNRRWASTMSGHGGPGITLAHRDSSASIGPPAPGRTRVVREEIEDSLLAPGATRARGAGDRLVAEQPDPWRTCFERDRDRILHATAFRRLAGKTQVFVFPDDHQRTRLTHALEVAQVATGVARACSLNIPLTEAIALGHDCGHGPGGHASEDALSPYLDGGFDHAPWGADVSLAPLNLCAETLDGIRNHSWSRPAPTTPEGEVVSWADRIAYVCHDFEDAVRSGIVTPHALPDVVRERCGDRRSQQLGTFIDGLVTATLSTGQVGMATPAAEALAAFRGGQLRAHLPPAELGGTGPRGRRRPASARRALRRPAEPHPRRQPPHGGPRRRRTGGGPRGRRLRGGDDRPLRLLPGGLPARMGPRQDPRGRRPDHPALNPSDRSRRGAGF